MSKRKQAVLDIQATFSTEHARRALKHLAERFHCTTTTVARNPITRTVDRDGTLIRTGEENVIKYICAILAWDPLTMEENDHEENNGNESDIGV